MENLVKWYRIKSKLNINTKNKKVKTIIYNSFDLFYCLKLFLFNKCRGPPTPFNFQIFTHIFAEIFLAQTVKIRYSYRESF